MTNYQRTTAIIMGILLASAFGGVAYSICFGDYGWAIFFSVLFIFALMTTIKEMKKL